MTFKIVKQTSSFKTIRRPDELIEKLQVLASLNHVSFNGIVIQACQYAVDEYEESDEDNSN